MKALVFEKPENPIIVERNTVAVRVMAEEHVPVADFYQALVTTPELSAGDGFHWTKPAYARLARLAADRIAEALKLPPSATPSTPATK